MMKNQIIAIATGLGFRLDLDKYNEKGMGWIRFQLKEELDEPDLRWIWYKEQTLEWNLERGSQILFKAGQKAFKQRLNEYIEL